MERSFFFQHDLSCKEDEEFNAAIIYNKGGIVQLSSKGPQDEYLTKDPDFTFWKTSFYQYAHFGQSVKEYRFGSSERMQILGQTLTCNLPVDDGSLLGPLTLEISLPALTQRVIGNRSYSSFVKWCHGGAMMLINRIEFIVNGNILQTFSGKVLDIESNLSVSPNHAAGYDKMTGRNQEHDGKTAISYYVPLPFWFCKFRASFPLCLLGLQTTVQFRVKLNNIIDCVQSNRQIDSMPAENSIGSCKLIADLYHIDAKERLEMVDRYSRKDVLIEEYQEQEEVIEPNLAEVKREILFSRCIKRIHWVLQDSSDKFPDNVLGNHPLRYDGWDQLYIQSKSQTILLPPIKTAQIYLGSDEREPLSFNLDKTRVHADFYTKIQPYKYSGCNTNFKNYIYSYFFALDPFTINIPSGHYNFSPLTNFIHIKLEQNLRRVEMFMYAVGFNICRFENGQAELFFVD
jgi:hypothetical protein